ncbi:unnamed protein product [Effrenium voratum]|nr:unnamed protein product [Effrenium voratum]CAJ1439063.1 unnamed protein product [Effrenium voratum]
MAREMEQQRMRGMLEPLQQQDPEVSQIVAYSKFVVAYFLQQDGPSPGWRKANIEGPVYLVRRRSAPLYQIIVKNQFSTSDLIDNLHPDWELDCQKNYIFYKIEDPNKQIRGLWFHNDTERVKIETVLEQTMEELRNKPMDAPKPAALTQQLRSGDVPAANGEAQLPQRVSDSESIVISRESVRAALHALADDDSYVESVWQKLKAKSGA